MCWVAQPEEHRTCRAGITFLGQRWLTREPPFRWEPALIPQLLLRTGDGCQPEIDSKPRHWETPSAWPRQLVVGTHVPLGGARTRQPLGRRDFVWGCSAVTACSEQFCCIPGGLGADRQNKRFAIFKPIPQTNQCHPPSHKPPEPQEAPTQNPRSRPKAQNPNAPAQQQIERPGSTQNVHDKITSGRLSHKTKSSIHAPIN